MTPSRNSIRPRRSHLLVFVLSFSQASCLLNHRPGSATSKQEKTAPETSSLPETPSSKESATKSSPRERNTGTESGERAPPNCGSDSESYCLDAAPAGWFGPLQIQGAKSLTELRPCPPGTDPFESRDDAEKRENTVGIGEKYNAFASEVFAEPAKCEGCEAKLDSIRCTDAEWVAKKYDPNKSPQCGEVDTSVKKLLLEKRCQHIVVWKPMLPDHLAESIVPPRPTKNPGCRIGIPASPPVLPASSFRSVHRMCLGTQQQESCADGEKRCNRLSEASLAPNLPLACVAKEGEHECPAFGYNGKRLLLHAKLEDTRGCGNCKLKFEPGRIYCDYSIRVAKNDPTPTCENAKPVNPLSFCLPDMDIQKAEDNRQNYSIIHDWTKPRYTGVCETYNWGSRGEVSLSRPYTVCCSALVSASTPTSSRLIHAIAD